MLKFNVHSACVKLDLTIFFTYLLFHWKGINYVTSKVSILTRIYLIVMKNRSDIKILNICSIESIKSIENILKVLKVSQIYKYDSFTV